MNPEEEKRILFICTAGITSGILVKNVQKAAEERGVVIHVYSALAIIAEQILQNQEIDGLMIGPQSEYEVARLKDFLNVKGIPYKLIRKEDYETFDGEAVLTDILHFFE